MKILTLTALTLAFLVAAFAADISGKWRAEFDSQIGQQKYTYDLKVAGDKITGQAISDQRAPVKNLRFFPTLFIKKSWLTG